MLNSLSFNGYRACDRIEGDLRPRGRGPLSVDEHLYQRGKGDVVDPIDQRIGVRVFVPLEDRDHHPGVAQDRLHFFVVQDLRAASEEVEVDIEPLMNADDRRLVCRSEDLG